jgi:hypothetical protein
MDNQPIAIWISAAALAISALLLAHGYLRKNPFVPASVAEELRAELAELRARLAVQAADISQLRIELASVMREREWWRGEYQKLKIG